MKFSAFTLSLLISVSLGLSAVKTQADEPKLDPYQKPMSVDELLKTKIRMRLGTSEYRSLRFESPDGLKIQAIFSKLENYGQANESETPLHTGTVYVDAEETHYSNGSFFNQKYGMLRLGFGQSGAYATHLFTRLWLELHRTRESFEFISGQYYDWVYREGGEIKTPAIARILRSDSGSVQPSSEEDLAFEKLARQTLVFTQGQGNEKRSVSFERVDEFGMKALLKDESGKLLDTSSVWPKSIEEGNVASNGTYFDPETGMLHLGFGPYGAYVTHWFSRGWIDMNQARGSFTWVSGIFRDWEYFEGQELSWPANYRVDTAERTSAPCDGQLKK
jgi:hypothetical protein